MILEIDGETCTWAEWEAGNLDLDPEEVALVWALQPGEWILFGGGAAAESIVRRIS